MFVSLLVCLVATSLFIGCASTPKEPRSIKTNAFKLQKFKNAQIVAENYGLDILFDSSREYNEKDFKANIGKYHSNNVLIARNPENHEAVVFIEFDDENNSRNNILFTYVSLNHEATSNIQTKIDDIGKVYLKNTEKRCELDSSTHDLKPEGYEKITKDLANFRSFCQGCVWKQFSVDCKIPINPEQAEIINKK